MKSLGLILVPLFFLAVTADAATAQSTVPSEVVSKCKDAIDLNNLSATIVLVNTYQDSDGPSNPRYWITRLTRRGNDFDTCFQTNSQGTWATGKPYSHRIILGDEFRSYEVAPPDPPLLMHWGHAATDSDVWRGESQIAGFADGWVFGSGDKDFFASLIGSKFQCTPDIISGISCYDITGNIPMGIIHVWIAPDKGCNPIKFTIESSPSDILRIPSQKSGWRDVKLNDYDDGSGHGPLISLKQTMDDVKLMQVSDRWFIQSATLTTETKYKFGWSSKRTETCTRDDLNIHPDFATAGAFLMRDVPDGTPVRSSEFAKTGIAYEWRDGKVQPAIDRSAVNTINGIIGAVNSGTSPVQPAFGTQAPAESSGNFWRWITGATLVIGLGAVAAFLWIKLMSKRPQT